MTHQMNTGLKAFSPKGLLTLFFAPTRYFSSLADLLKKPAVILAIWLSGVAYVIEKVDFLLMRVELESNQTIKVQLANWLTESWLHYWMYALSVGFLSGLIIWYVGGWWYKKRLNWCGAKEVAAQSANIIYIYQDMVQSLPMVCATLIQMLLYHNYLAAWEAEEYWSTLVVIFFFWSCVTSYKAVRANFAVGTWRARIWFLILPTIMILAGIFLASISMGLLY